MWFFGKQQQQQLDRIEKYLILILQNTKGTLTQMNNIDAVIADLTQKVAAETAEDQSAIVLINGIPGMIAAAVAEAQNKGATPEQLASFQTLSDALTTNATNLGAAVVAGTPSAPASN